MNDELNKNGTNEINEVLSLENGDLHEYSIKDSDIRLDTKVVNTEVLEQGDNEFVNGHQEDKERLGGGGLGLGGGGFRGGAQPSLADFQPPYFPPPFAPAAHPAHSSHPAHPAHPASPHHQQQSHGMDYGGGGGGEYGQHYAPQQLLPRHHSHHETHAHLRHHRDHHDIHSHHLSHGGFGYGGGERRADYGAREQHELALHHALHSTDETQNAGMDDTTGVHDGFTVIKKLVH
ncbi:hypothetical protein RR46_07933 [Papilio xuthus]|uniref:Uncharacterized protein n=1 Tax=Papilio xuthus TaxID=66420 RepID=A0A194QFI5_PAPXU|nr:hypothetical protein RR46_07933 [Papilio xuthus]